MRSGKQRERGGRAYAQLLMGGPLQILSSAVELIERFFLRLVTVIEVVSVCVCAR